MHLHGHNFYVLHEGPGLWDGAIVRPSNPHRRDVHLVRANGHLVIQFDAAPGTLFSPLLSTSDSLPLTSSPLTIFTLFTPHP